MQPTIGINAWGSEIALSDFARARHTYIIGKTGSGKSTLLLSLISQDLAAGRGLAVIDPHGDLARAVIDQIPTSRAHHLVYLDLADADQPVGFNPLRAVTPDARAFVADNMVSALRHVWPDSWGPRLEHILAHALRSLLELPDATLLMVPRLLTDEAWRGRVLSHVRDPLVLAFWRDEFDTWPRAYRSEAIAPILNKIGRFLATPAIRNIIAQPAPAFDLGHTMDEGRILVVNLAKGRVGEGPAHLMGALIVTAVMQQALARAAVAPDRRLPFTLYADEFQAFATASFAVILSEARKYALELVLAHQHLSQIPEALCASVLANVATLVALHVGADDALPLARHFGFTNPDSFDIRAHTAWVRSLTPDGPTQPDILDLAPPPVPRHTRADRLIANTRIRFGRPRHVVEERIEKFLRRRG